MKTIHHLVDVVEHGLSSTEHFATDWTGTSTDPVLLLQVSVESLDEGCSLITEMTSPGFVVRVVSVHVVHQPAEPTTLFVTNLTDTELLVILGYFPLGDLTHLPGLGRLVPLYPRSPSLPWLWLTAANISK